MKVRPNKFKYQRRFRSKWFKKYKIKFLKYGQWGLKILNYIFLTARHLNRYRIMMHISVRRGSLHNRSMWIRFNISIPLTKKPKGSRMGSGKGKLYAWGFKTFGGTIFFELKNIKQSKAFDFCRQLSDSLNCSTKFVYCKLNPTARRNYGFLNGRYNSRQIYWFIMLYIYLNYFSLILIFLFFSFVFFNIYLNIKVNLNLFKLNTLIIIILIIYLKLFFLFNFYSIYFHLINYNFFFIFNISYIYYFPFLFIFILITIISLLFCLNYNFLELNYFILYISFIIFSGFNLLITDSLLVLFFFYECLLIPSFFILYLFSKTRRSVEASYLMFFWTQFGAMWLIFIFIYIYSITGSFNFYTINLFNFSKFDNYIITICLLFGFGVKLPIWPFYEWLPKAHVEASTNFSIFLSGVLVKFAFFGFFKCFFIFGIDISFFLIFPYLLFGLIDSTFKMFYQVDIKKLIAYSTVIEMHWLLICSFSGNNILLLSAFGMFISHAILSTNSFLIIDSIARRFKTRLIFEISGINFLCPKLFLFSLLNIIVFLGFPGSLFFISEFLFFSYSFDLFPIYSLIILVLIYFILANFFIKIWMGILFSSINANIKKIPSDLDKIEIIIFSFLLFMIFWLGSSWLSFIF